MIKGMAIVSLLVLTPRREFSFTSFFGGTKNLIFAKFPPHTTLNLVFDACVAADNNNNRNILEDDKRDDNILARS